MTKRILLWLIVAQHVAGRRVITNAVPEDPPMARCESDTYRRCVDGIRPHPKCPETYTFMSETYTETCIKGEFQHWCPFQDNASRWTLGSSWGYCDSCADWADPPEALDYWRPAMEKLTCSSRTDGTRFLHVLGSFPILASAGDVSGRKFSFQTINQAFTPLFGGRSSDDLFQKWWEHQYTMFSAGKWPSTVAIAGAVRDGNLSWDTRANEVFDWWTRSPDDRRSRVTLRHLLQFRSGFIVPDGDFHGFITECMNPLEAASSSTLDHCAKDVYEQAEHAAEPGDLWNYSSLHLHIAFAMATKQTGLHPQQFLQDYLYTPAGMTKTRIIFHDNPIMAAGMLSTPKDYDSFLQRYLSYEILPKEIVDVIEAPSLVANKPDWGMGLYCGEGRYSSDEDLPNTGWSMSMHTQSVDCGWGGGLWGSVNREKGTYMLVAPLITSYAGEAFANIGQLREALDLRKANFALDLWKTVRNEFHAALDKVQKSTPA